MKTVKQTKLEAKRLFHLCLINKTLDEGRVRQVLQNILQSKHRGYLALAAQFFRLVRLDQLRHTAKVESAVPLSFDLRTNVEKSLVQTYGPDLSTSFAEDPALIGGMRIRVASDVYDGSVKAGLAALEKSFETNGASI